MFQYWLVKSNLMPDHCQLFITAISMSFHGIMISYFIAVKCVMKISKNLVHTCWALHFSVGSVFQQDTLDKELFPLCFQGFHSYNTSLKMHLHTGNCTWKKYVEKIHLQISNKFIFLNPKPKGLQWILYAQGFTSALFAVPKSTNRCYLWCQKMLYVSRTLKLAVALEFSHD